MAVLADNLVPTDGIRHKQTNTSFFVKSNHIGDGVLYITESMVTWVATDNRIISIPYNKIHLHAISRDLSRFNHECLYLHADVPELDPPEDNEDDENDPTELRFVPADKESLNAMFQAMADCQALNPDPDLNQGSDDDAFIWNHSDDEEYDLNGAHRELADLHLSANATTECDEEMDEDNFQDADGDT